MRIIAFTVTWMLTPRVSNHVVLIEEDLVLIYYIMKNIKVNWIHVFKEHMKKSIRLSDYYFPYIVLISKFFQYFEINLDEELSEIVKPSHEINNGSLNKIGFTKIGEKWVIKEEEHVGHSQKDQTGTNDGHQSAPNVRNQYEHEQEEQGTANPNEQAVDETYEVSPSA